MSFNWGFNIETNQRPQQLKQEAAKAAPEDEGEFLIILSLWSCLAGNIGRQTKFSDWNIKITRKLQNSRLTEHYRNILGQLISQYSREAFSGFLSTLQLLGIRKLMTSV